jgi:hypothetical protein
MGGNNFFGQKKFACGNRSQPLAGQGQAQTSLFFAKGVRADGTACESAGGSIGIKTGKGENFLSH